MMSDTTDNVSVLKDLPPTSPIHTLDACVSNQPAVGQKFQSSPGLD